MATRRNANPPIPRTFMLTISNDDFKIGLTQRIEIGEELLSRQIQSQEDYNKLKHDTVFSDSKACANRVQIKKRLRTSLIIA